MLPAIPDDSKKSGLWIKRNPMDSKPFPAETSRNHVSAISAVIASVAGTRRLVRQGKRTSKHPTPPDQQRPHPSLSFTSDTDTMNTLKRHNAAIENLRSGLADRRNEWRSFEFSGRHTWSESRDSSRLRQEIEKVLDAKRQSIKNTTAISKSKAVIEYIYQALSPFFKSLLTVGRNVQSVYSCGVIVC